MGFVGVFTALYDYHPQSGGELELHEGDLLYILEKSTEDDWWRAKKKAEREDEDEPEGLVPSNYVEEARQLYKAKALYDYTRQTDEEVSFSENSTLVVYDTSDPDWTLVSAGADFGFAPSNYIEIIQDDASVATQLSSSIPRSLPDEPPAPSLPRRPTPESPSVTDNHNPAAAAIASIIHQQSASNLDLGPPRQPPRPRPTYESEDFDDNEHEPEPPSLPRRPPSQQTPSYGYSPSGPSQPPRPSRPWQRDSSGERHIQESPPYPRVGDVAPHSPSGYHIYNVNEMIEVMGKRKKMPTTLGINVAAGTIFMSSEDNDDQQEWAADKLVNYSMEGKHVFVDLVRPSKSVDFHAGAKDTAREIVSALGEISGAYRAEGLREVLEAGTGSERKKGQILYDFTAQGEDEVTVSVGDEVIIMDDVKSEEWWVVRRLRNGKEGVVPSSYVEITGTVPSADGDASRLENATSTKDVMRRTRADPSDPLGADRDFARSPEQHVRSASSNGTNRHAHRYSRDNKGDIKQRPDPSKTRQWTDRTKTFSVEAQFIGLQDGKIHLHKMNGVKIAVPASKMSIGDLEYVEKITGVSLDEDRPLSDIRQRSQRIEPDKPDGKEVGASVQPDYDWFDFFLKAGVGPHQCERYAQNFIKDSMDKAVLPDIGPDTLRTLGLKEGDILRVMRYLDNTLGRGESKSKTRNVSFGGEEVIKNEESSQGGLFSGPGGTLRNNTRKSRPAPAIQTSDVVDAKIFEQKETSQFPESKSTSPPAESEKSFERGFDDDAWGTKQPKQVAAAANAAPPAAPPPAANQQLAERSLTGALADLALLHPPLQPSSPQRNTVPPLTATTTQLPQPTATEQPPQQLQPIGATPSFFSQVGQQAQKAAQQAGFQQQTRQPPQPLQSTSPGSLVLPPQRPLSAPQNFPQPQDFPQQNGFVTLPVHPHLTGAQQPAVQAAPLGQSLAELGQQRVQASLPPQQAGLMASNQFPGGIAQQPTGFQPQSRFGIQQQQQAPFMGGQPIQQPIQQQQAPFINGQPIQQPIQQQQQMPVMNGQPIQQPSFQSLGLQPTGFGGFQQQLQQPMQAGINSSLPPALQPQRPTQVGMNLRLPPAFQPQQLSQPGINPALPPPLQPQPTSLSGIGPIPYTSTPPQAPPIPQQPAAAPLQVQKTGPPPLVRFGVKPDSPKRLAPQPTGLRANLLQATPSNPFGY